MIQAWGRGANGTLVPISLNHSEVKRDGAQPNEVDKLDGQVQNACEGALKSQTHIFGTAFWGTSIRVWRWARPVFAAMSGSDTDSPSDRENWVDMSDSVKSPAILAAYLHMVRFPPFTMVMESNL